MGLAVEGEKKLKSDSDELRGAEKFLLISSGEAVCKSCGYQYKPEKGDYQYPIPRGTLFGNLPEDWSCPICGVDKTKFESKTKLVAGFAENQQYGFGTNAMTGEQKTLIIYWTLFFFFALFISGYLLK